MTIADTPISNDPDASSNIHFCNFCNKPIISETAFKRHLAYCRRTLGKPKKRKRSCKQCHRAKVKCNFDLPCSRCASKGVLCEYEKKIAPSLISDTSNDIQDASMSEPSESSPRDDIGSPDYEYSGLPSFEWVATVVGLQQFSPSPPRPVTELRTDPKHHASAMFLLETIRALPYMMSRRETLPIFIHGQWHKSELPNTLANCVRICRLYVTRNTSPNGRQLFYSAINEEAVRLTHRLSTATKEELSGSLAVQGIYTLLAVLENQPPQAGLIPELVVRKCDVDVMTNIAHRCFEYDAYRPFDIDTVDDPNETWEEFIYTESRRRCALFWFIVSRVVHLRHGLRCPPVLGYRGLSLPAPEALWSARTKEDWEAARAEIREHRQEPLYNTTLRTVGDLIESRERASDPDCERQLCNWLASCDKLGLMIEVASTMV